VFDCSTTVTADAVNKSSKLTLAALDAYSVIAVLGAPAERVPATSTPGIQEDVVLDNKILVNSIEVNALEPTNSKSNSIYQPTDAAVVPSISVNATPSSDVSATNVTPETAVVKSAVVIVFFQSVPFNET